MRRWSLPREPLLKVLFATSEFSPLVKTGGLADVSGSLPVALRSLGVDVRVLLPGYPAVLAAVQGEPEVVGRVGPAAELPGAQLLSVRATGGVELLVLHCPQLFDRPGNPYLGPDGRDWPDNALRYALLSRVAAQLGAADSPLPWIPDVVHCQDWQAALAPVYLAYGPARRAGSVVTIHNLAYQGVFPADTVARIALPPESFAIDGVEFYGNLSFLKGGLACADAVTTVSPTYAREICTDALGFGLQGLLRTRQDVLVGILNGVDTGYWDPATDPLIARRYDRDRLGEKAANKRALQSALGLDVTDDTPMLGLVSRLVEQKGIDLLADILDRVVRLPAQVVIQGSGDRGIEKRLREVASRHPNQVGVRIAFDEALAHMIEAGADLFLMPSRFEPCGMNQMYSQRYGTPPVVCRTGGLADSVTDCTAQTLADGSASGFSFAPASAEALLQAIERAVALYRRPQQWRALQRLAMARDVSWEASARRYLEVYERVARRSGPRAAY